MTEDEAAIYTKVSKELCEQISEHFSAFGCTHLSRIEDSVEAIEQESVELFFNGKPWGYYNLPRSIPFMIAVLHDFTPNALAEIVTRFHISPIGFIDEMESIDEKIPSKSDRYVDSRVFCAKMAEAFHIAFPLEAKDLFSRNFDHSGIAIAFVAGGDSYGVADELINHEFALAKKGVFKKNAQQYHLPSLQSELSEFPGLITRLEHLPNSSPIEFFDKIGAWNPNILKKTLSQNACWENLIASRTHKFISEPAIEMMESLTNPLYAGLNKNKLDMMLSNIAMDTTEYEHDYHKMVEEMLEWVSSSPFDHYTSKITFGLSLTRNYIRFADSPVNPQELFCNDPSTGPHCLELQDLFVKKGCRFYQAIIDETLSMPDDHIGFHHLTIPFVTNNLNLATQVTKKGSFEKYLNKLARVSLNYQLDVDPPVAKQQIDNMIDLGMRHWVSKLGQTMKLNPKLLDFNDEKMAEKFIRWGMDINLAPSPTEKSMTMALERDLGI